MISLTLPSTSDAGVIRSSSGVMPSFSSALRRVPSSFALILFCSLGLASLNSHLWNFFFSSSVFGRLTSDLRAFVMKFSSFPLSGCAFPAAEDDDDDDAAAAAAAPSAPFFARVEGPADAPSAERGSTETPLGVVIMGIGPSGSAARLSRSMACWCPDGAWLPFIICTSLASSTSFLNSL